MDHLDEIGISLFKLVFFLALFLYGNRGRRERGSDCPESVPRMSGRGIARTMGRWSRTGVQQSAQVRTSESSPQSHPLWDRDLDA